jgi:hypothetical protein
LVPVGATEHETAKKFITDQFDGSHTFGISGSSGAGNYPGRRKLFEFRRQEGRSNANCTNASICLEGFNMSAELLEVFVIVITILLVVGKETLV